MGLKRITSLIVVTSLLLALFPFTLTQQARDGPIDISPVARETGDKSVNISAQGIDVGDPPEKDQLPERQGKIVYVPDNVVDRLEQSGTQVLYEIDGLRTAVGLTRDREWSIVTPEWVITAEVDGAPVKYGSVLSPVAYSPTINLDKEDVLNHLGEKVGEVNNSASYIFTFGKVEFNWTAPIDRLYGKLSLDIPKDVVVDLVYTPRKTWTEDNITDSKGARTLTLEDRGHRIGQVIFEESPEITQNGQAWIATYTGPLVIDPQVTIGGTNTEVVLDRYMFDFYKAEGYAITGIWYDTDDDGSWADETDPYGFMSVYAWGNDDGANGFLHYDTTPATWICTLNGSKVVQFYLEAGLAMGDGLDNWLSGGSATDVKIYYTMFETGEIFTDWSIYLDDETNPAYLDMPNWDIVDATWNYLNYTADATNYTEADHTEDMVDFTTEKFSAVWSSAGSTPTSAMYWNTNWVDPTGNDEPYVRGQWDTDEYITHRIFPFSAGSHQSDQTYTGSQVSHVKPGQSDYALAHNLYEIYADPLTGGEISVTTGTSHGYKEEFGFYEFDATGEELDVTITNDATPRNITLVINNMSGPPTVQTGSGYTVEYDWDYSRNATITYELSASEEKQFHVKYEGYADITEDDPASGDITVIWDDFKYVFDESRGASPNLWIDDDGDGFDDETEFAWDEWSGWGIITYQDYDGDESYEWCASVGDADTTLSLMINTTALVQINGDDIVMSNSAHPYYVNYTIYPDGLMFWNTTFTIVNEGDWQQVQHVYYNFMSLLGTFDDQYLDVDEHDSTGSLSENQNTMDRIQGIISDWSGETASFGAFTRNVMIDPTSTHTPDLAVAYDGNDYATEIAMRIITGETINLSSDAVFQEEIVTAMAVDSDNSTIANLFSICDTPIAAGSIDTQIGTENGYQEGYGWYDFAVGARNGLKFSINATDQRNLTIYVNGLSKDPTAAGKFADWAGHDISSTYSPEYNSTAGTCIWRFETGASGGVYYFEFFPGGDGMIGPYLVAGAATSMIVASAVKGRNWLRRGFNRIRRRLGGRS